MQARCIRIRTCGGGPCGMSRPCEEIFLHRPPPQNSTGIRSTRRYAFRCTAPSRTAIFRNDNAAAVRALRSIRSRLSSGRRLPSRQARSIPAPQRSECTFSHTQNLLFRILPFPDDTPPFPLSCPEARFPNIRRRRETDSRYTTSENGTTKLRKRRTSGKRVRDSRIPPATTASLAEFALLLGATVLLLASCNKKGGNSGGSNTATGPHPTFASILYRTGT